MKSSRLHTFLLILGIVLVASNLRASITAVGPLIGAIVADTGLSSAPAGLLTTLPVLAFAALSLQAPKLARRFGMEYTLGGSLVLLTAGILLRSVPSIAALFAGTAVLGMAIAVGNVLLPSLIKREFPHHVGLLTGVYSMSMNMWAAIASGISVPLSQGLHLGWRGTLLCWAVLSVIGIILWMPQLRHRHIPSAAALSRDGQLWRSALAWQVTLFMGLQSLSFYATVAWLPEILHDRGLSVVTSGWMLSLMQLVSLPASFLVPMLAGRLENQRGIVVVTACFMLGGYFGLLGGSGFIPLWIALIGFSQGASISLALTFIGLRTTGAQQAAQLSGMAQSVGYLLAAAGPVLLGLLHDLSHAWTAPMLVLVLAAVFQLVAGVGAGRRAYVESGRDSAA